MVSCTDAFVELVDGVRLNCVYIEGFGFVLLVLLVWVGVCLGFGFYYGSVLDVFWVCFGVLGGFCGVAVMMVCWAVLVVDLGRLLYWSREVYTRFWVVFHGLLLF